MGKHRPNAATLRLAAAVFVCVILLCLGWTLWLMALTLLPNDTANRILKTRDLDGGTFWHFPQMPNIIGPIGVAGLAVVALGHIYLLWRVIKILCRNFCWCPGKRAVAPNSTNGPILKMMVRSIEGVGVAPHPLTDKWASARRSRVASATMSIVNSLASHSLQQRKNIAVKVGDIVLHCVILVQLLEAGMPVALIAVFAAIAAMHALIFAVVFAARHRTTGRFHLLLDTAFDLVVAVGFPMLVVVHSLSLFHFDAQVMSINNRVFPPGSFERTAAVVADPLQVVAVRRSLVSLQVNSLLSVVTRVGTMLMLVRRLHQVARLLEDVWTRRDIRFRASCYDQQRSLGPFFVVVAIAVIVLTEESVRTAAVACRPHSECAQHSHRLLFNLNHNDLTQCPCLAIVDRNIMVASYEEWTSPPDRAAAIAQLATSGKLHTIQLVNRGLAVFPDELRRCKHLRHVSLYYTNTESLPDWFGEFTELEFLHIEGKYPRSSLVHVPENVFDRMSALTFLHLGLHSLETLPSFAGATSLKSLSLAGLPQVTEFPRLDTLRNLQQLSVVGLPRLTSFPDLTNLHQLVALNVADRGAFCCNGFLGPSKCNLSHSLCKAHKWSGAPAVTQCVSPDVVASAKTRAVFDRFNTSACFGNAFSPGFVINPPHDNVAQCNGTLYRACHIAGVNASAICYNTRWTVVSCSVTPQPPVMRREQIRQGVGLPCNPKYEAWLGCGNTTA